MARTPKPWYRKDRKSWFVTIDGKRHNLGNDREQAFKRYHELMIQPKAPKISYDSLALMVDTFLEWNLKHRAKRTFDWYKERCESFLRQFPDLTINQLKPFHIQQWIDSNENWSDGHKRGCISAMQRVLRWANKMGYIDHNPIAYMEKPQYGKRDKIITPDEFDQILNLVPDDEFSDLLNIAWETGARPQEIIRVEARHIDLINRRWVFPREESKGKKRIRTIYLSKKAFEISCKYQSLNPDGPLFRNTAGTPWTPYSVNCRFNRLKTKLGVKYCLYLFRHTYATRLLESGMDAMTVSTLMGHADTSMLARVYQHLSHNPDFLLKQLNQVS